MQTHTRNLHIQFKGYNLYFQIYSNKSIKKDLPPWLNLHEGRGRRSQTFSHSLPLIRQKNKVPWTASSRKTVVCNHRCGVHVREHRCCNPQLKMNAVDTVVYNVLSFSNNLEQNFLKGERKMYVLVGCMWTLVDTISSWGLDLQGINSFISVDARRAVSVCSTLSSVLRTPRTICRNPVHGISGVPWKGVSAFLPGVSAPALVLKIYYCQRRHTTSLCCL